MRAACALIGAVFLVLAGCATGTIPFQALREPAWGYTGEDGTSIYIYETRPGCRLRGLDACRQVVLDRGGEFYWLISLAEGPLWAGSTQQDICVAMRDHVRVELRQPASECTRAQLLLE
jgi:hypothetical protein